MMRRLLVATSLAIALGAGDDHAGHDHGDAFEWAGTFATPNKIYFWQAEKVGGDYADPAMKIAFLPVSGTDMATLKAEEKEGSHALEETCEAVNAGGTMKPMKDKCYSLKFDANSHSSVFKIDTSATSNVAIFAEHVPTEFERNSHYLKDIAGEDIEPGAELPEPEVYRPWGAAIGAAILVNLVTIIGVVFLAPMFAKMRDQHPKAMSVVINTFACGALLAAAFYLMFYEATHLIKPEGSNEAQQTAWWGSACLLGFLASYIIDLFMSILIPGKAPSTTATTKDVEGADAPGADAGRSIRVCAGVLLGDFMHNLVDGFFIGFGFMMCKDSFGWMITGATIGHEIAQEIADYLVLTDTNQGNLKPVKALAFNFVSGTSVILGTIIIMAQGAEDNFALGMLLAFGAGIYMQVACAECMPRASEAASTAKMRAVGLASFLVGAIAIAIVLVGHEHCSAGGGHEH